MRDFTESSIFGIGIHAAVATTQFQETKKKKKCQVGRGLITAIHSAESGGSFSPN